MANIAQIASKVFAGNAAATTVRKVLPKTGTTIEVFRNGANGLKKVVTKANGNKVISNMTADGKHVTGILEETARGTISHSFGGVPYSKVVDVDPKIGGTFTLLGHTDRAGGQLWSTMSGRYNPGNKYMPQYQEALDYIRGKNTQYLYSYCRLNNGKTLIK